MQQLLQDPRASGLEYIIRTHKLQDFFKRTWDAKAGTIVIPTAEAFDSLLDDLGMAVVTTYIDDTNPTSCVSSDISLANLTTAVSNATWASVLPSYFLTNTSYLPKDFFNQVYQTSGDFFLYASLFRNATAAAASILLRYVDITSSVIRSGAQPIANVAPFGKPAMVTDFSLVCDQFVVYWLDAVLLPITSTCALTKAGCGSNTTLAGVVNAVKASG